MRESKVTESVDAEASSQGLSVKDRARLLEKHVVVQDVRRLMHTEAVHEVQVPSPQCHPTAALKASSARARGDASHSSTEAII